MAVNVTLPKWGMTMKEGKIIKWYKEEGDTIQEGEPLFEVETEKITNIVEAVASGILFQILVPADTTVSVGTILAVIAEPGEQPELIEGIQIENEDKSAAAVDKTTSKIKAQKSVKEFVPASPAARRLAKELHVDLAQIKGSGPKGRITETDVKHYTKERPSLPKITPLAAEMVREMELDITLIEGMAQDGKITKSDVQQFLDMKEGEEYPRQVSQIPLSGMRRSIAENMHFSLQNTAQLTLFSEIDVTEMIKFRDTVRHKYANEDAAPVSANDIIIFAMSRALKQHRIMNTTLIDGEIFFHDTVNIGIAVDIPDGLIVPVLKGADDMSLIEIAGASRKLVRKARDRALSVDEVAGGTFTISNLNKSQVDGFTPILRSPETGILGAGRIKPKPAVYKDKIGIRSMMFLSLTFDHRVVDGAPAAEFLQTVAQYLENPYLLMA